VTAASIFSSATTWPGRPQTDLFCTIDGRAQVLLHAGVVPRRHEPALPQPRRRDLRGRHDEAGDRERAGKSLGVVVYDHDGDGRPDIAVANDTQPNQLFRNRGDGTFEEIGREVGIAFSESGVARGGMGIDAADYDGGGRESIVIGNFSNEMVALYHNEGGGLYVDDAASAGVGLPSLLTLAFGAFFFDCDLDGRLDLFVANGHVEPDIHAVQKNVTYAEPPHLFRNLGGGKFEPMGAAAGRGADAPGAWRAARRTRISTGTETSTCS
jgi:hypothetical protein